MQMTENELSEVISKFQMPEGRYLIEQEGSFGRGEFFWIIKNQSTNQKYLLMNTYSHHGVEAELECYPDDEISKYLFGMFSLFEIKS